MMAPSMLITVGRGQSLPLWESKGGIGQEMAA